jgi:phytoene dehydrogenase-like protein
LGVVFRQTDRIAGAVVEWDRVEGLSLDDGGQIRASVVVSALGARESFLGLLSHARLDIEFANLVSAPSPRLASVRAHIAIEGEIDDAVIAARPDRRLFYAPPAGDIHPAWRLALEGGAGGPAIAEALVTSALDPSLAPAGSTAISMLMHPVGLHALDGESARTTLEAAVSATLDRLIPGAATKVVAIDCEPLVPAAAPVAVAAARRRAFAEAAGIDGFFFCGPESRLGARLTLTAGRRAAERAIAYAKDEKAAR